MRNIINLTALLFLFSLSSFGQGLPENKSEEHIQIEGTNVFMIPPVSFEASSNFKGFQSPSDQTSMIMVVEIPGPYSEVTKGFNAEALEPRGMELTSKKEITVAGFEGLLIEMDQAANGMTFSKLILIYGDEDASTVVNGVFLADSIRLGESIKESILSTFVDTEVESNPRVALSYTINEEVGGLKYLSVMGNAILFNRDLKTPTESEDKATLLVDRSFAKVEIQDKKGFCYSRLEEYPGDFSILENTEISDIAIDDLEGFELSAKNGEKEEMYMVILFENDGGYYIIVGTYLAGSEGAKSDIRSIVRTFARKTME